MRNHLLGIYCSDVELFSNLDLTQHFYDAFVTDPEIAQKLEQGYLSFADFEKHEQFVLQQAQTGAMAVVESLSDQQCRELHEHLNKLYGDGTALHELLETLYAQSQRYADRMKNEAEKKGQPRAEGE